MTYDEFMRGYNEYKQQGGAGGNSGAAPQSGNAGSHGGTYSGGQGNGNGGGQAMSYDEFMRGYEEYKRQRGNRASFGGDGQGGGWNAMTYDEFMEGFYQLHPERRPQQAPAVPASTRPLGGGSMPAAQGAASGNAAPGQNVQESPEAAYNRQLYGRILHNQGTAQGNTPGQMTAAQTGGASQVPAGSTTAKDAWNRALQLIASPALTQGASESDWTAQQALEAARQAAEAAEQNPAVQRAVQRAASGEQTSGLRGAWTNEQARAEFEQRVWQQDPGRFAMTEMLPAYFWNGLTGGVRSAANGVAGVMSAMAKVREVGTPFVTGLLDPSGNLQMAERMQQQTDRIRQAVNDFATGNAEKSEQEAEKLAERFSGMDGAAANMARWVGGGVGSMVPQIAAGALGGPAASGALIFGQGMGDYYTDALADGATTDQALAAGLIGGAANYGIEKAFGGIPLVGEGVVPVDEVISRYVRSRTGRIILNRLAEATGEGIEEVAENYLKPAVQRLTYGKEIEWPTLQENLDSFAGGFFASLATGTVMEDLPQQRRAGQQGQAVRAAEGGEARLLDEARRYAEAGYKPGEEGGIAARRAQEVLKTLDRGGRVSDAMLGELAAEIAQAREAGVAPSTEVEPRRHDDLLFPMDVRASVDTAGLNISEMGQIRMAGLAGAGEVNGSAEGTQADPAGQAGVIAEGSADAWLRSQAAREAALKSGATDTAQLTAIDRMARQKGLEVRYLYQPGSSVDGWINGSTIAVNLASEGSAFGVAVHETGHAIKAADAVRFAEFEQAVLRLAESDAVLKEYADKVRQAYTAEDSPALQGLIGADGQVDAAALNEEVALKLAEQLVHDPERMIDAVTRERGLGGVLLDFIRGIKNSIAIRLTGSQKAMLDEAERQLVNLLRGDAGSVEGQRFSVQQDADGHTYVQVDTDQDIFEGKTLREKIKIAREYMKQHFQGQVLALGDSSAFVNGQSVDEYLYPANSRLDPNVRGAKVQAGTELDNLLSVSTFLRHDSDDGRHDGAIGGWDTYRTEFELAGERFTGEVKVMNTDRGRLFYDITHIEKTARIGLQPTSRMGTATSGYFAGPSVVPFNVRETHAPISDGSAREQNSLNNNIAQNGGDVNAKAGASGNLTESQVTQQLSALHEEQRALKQERTQWQTSEEVRAVLALKDQKRSELGIFGLQKWKQQNAEWKRYEEQRSEFKDRANQLRMREDALAEQAEKHRTAHKELAWQEELKRQQDHDRAVAESGLAPETYRRKAAVEQFGTTNRFEEAGFLLPDGRMLDFSGGERGARTRDHRDIRGVFGPAELGRGATGTDALNRFLAEGNIRVMAETPGVDLCAKTKPTNDQIAAISRMASTLGNAKHRFGLDISDENGNRVATRWYEGHIRGERIANDIRAFYANGVLPEESGIARFHSLAVPYRTPKGEVVQEYLQRVYGVQTEMPGKTSNEASSRLAEDTQGELPPAASAAEEWGRMAARNYGQPAQPKTNGDGWVTGILDRPAEDGNARTEGEAGKQAQAAPAGQDGASAGQNTGAEGQQTGPALKASAKSLEIQKRATRSFVDKVAGALSVPKWASREFLRPIAERLAEAFKTEGKIDKALADEMFETAYEQGIIQDTEMVDQFGDLRKEIRGTALRLDRETLGSKSYNELRRKYFGILQLSKDGVPIDSYYMELCEAYPELFDSEITHPADQAERIYEVCKSIEVISKDLDAYYGDDAEDFKRFARDGFDQALEELTGGLYKVRRLEADNARRAGRGSAAPAGQNAAAADGQQAQPGPMTYERAKSIWKDVRRLEREADWAMAGAALTEGDKEIVRRLEDGNISEEYLRYKKQENLEEILRVAGAKKAAKEAKRPIIEHNARVRAERAENAMRALEGTETWKDKSSGTRYALETQERNLLDISDGGEAGRRMIEQYFAPVHRHEADATRMKNKFRERIEPFKLNRWESAYAQIWGEQQGIIESDHYAHIRGDNEAAHLAKAMQKLMAEHGRKIDTEKAQAAANEIRKALDELFEIQNEALVANGYEPVKYRKGYFPHFEEGKTDTLINNIAALVGLGKQPDELPTSIAGLTDGFKPGKRWNPHEKQRTGYHTEYNALKGFDLYLEVAADVIHHTEDIRKLRALAEAIRYKYGDEGIKEQIRALQADESLDEATRDERNAALTGAGKSHLSNYVQNLDEYTNLLAGKKSRLDRTVEHYMGRGLYRAVGNMAGRVAANMVAVNLGSWFTNFLPATQVAAETGTGNALRAARDMISAVWHDDGFHDRSDFLTNRTGSGMLSKTRSQRWSEFLSKPMDLIDGFASEFVTRSYYHMNIRHGLGQVEAMQAADRMAAGLMADRSKGAQPTIFESKNPLIRTLTMFQVEVNNEFRHLAKDIPELAKELKKGGGKIMAMIVGHFVAAYVYNDLYELFTGRRCALDPIDLMNQAFAGYGGIALPNTFKEAARVLNGTANWEEDTRTERKGLTDTTLGLAKDAASELPFIGGVLGGGRVPVGAALPNIVTIAENGLDYAGGEKTFRQAAAGVGRELAKPLWYLGPPIGGSQIKKSLEGLGTMARGGYYTQGKDGEQLQAAVDQSDPASWILAGLFGRGAIQEMRDYYDGPRRGLTAEQTAIVDELGMTQKEGMEWYATFGGRGDSEDRSNFYQVRFGEDAADLDQRLARMREEGVTGVLPAKPDRTLNVNGEEVELDAKTFKEYTETRASGSYELLSYLPQLEAASADAELQAAYARRVQEYMAEVAKEQAADYEPKDWVTDVRAYAGTSGGQVNDTLANVILGRVIVSLAKPDKWENGNSVKGSRQRNAIKALEEIGFDRATAMELWELFG